MSPRPDLPAEIADLLAGADDASPMPPEALAKVALRLERTLSLPKLDVPLRDEVARQTVAESRSSFATRLSTLLRGRVALGVGMYALGAVTTLVVQQRLPRPQEPTATPTVTVHPNVPASPAASASPAALAAAAAPELVAPEPAAAASVAVLHTASVGSSRAEVPAVSNLAVERHLLEVARAALARGRPNEALAALDEHRRRFPSGELGEESDSLRVDALVASGSYEQARSAAARFNAAHPGSMLRASVNRALGSIP